MKKNLQAYHEGNRYFDIFKDFTLQDTALETKRIHIENVKKTALAIADFSHSKVDRELLAVLAEHHDDGRVVQYEILGKFWDTKISHFALGVDRVDRYITDNNLKVDDEIALLRKTMMYHGRMHLLGEVTTEEAEYIELITAADTFENATSCVSYLTREIFTDAKGYLQENPKQDQRQITNSKIWEWYTSGTEFDKFKYCKTYADYVLFAATLATSCIKKYGKIAKVALMQPGYGYPSILEGFKQTFGYALRTEDSERAYQIISNMVRAL